MNLIMINLAVCTSVGSFCLMLGSVKNNKLLAILGGMCIIFALYNSYLVGYNKGVNHGNQTTNT